MAVRIGSRTIQLNHAPSIVGFAAVGAKKEKEGPLADYFDYLSEDSSFGEKTWEKAETLMQKKAIELALQKGGIQKEQIDFLFAGDLLNQCISSAYASRELQLPFFGLYGACSTMAEALCLAAFCAAAGYAHEILAMSSSHFCAAERQFRTPLEYGAKRTPTAQWTATAAGACLVRAHGTGVPVRSVTFGRVQDYAVHDINNMGAAMMPAAASTLLRYFAATGVRPQDFDAIFTGDLGEVGSALLHEQMAREGLPLDNHRDCGCLPLDCECYMFGKCWTGAYCRYFREAVLPLDPALEAALLAEGPRPDFKACPVCGRAVAPDGRQTYCSAACAKAAHRRQQREYMRKKRG